MKKKNKNEMKIKLFTWLSQLGWKKKMYYIYPVVVEVNGITLIIIILLGTVVKLLLLSNM